MHPTPTAPLPWNAEDLWERLEPWLPGLSIEIVPQCDSTNTVLLERARAEWAARLALPNHTEPGPALVRRSRESAAFGRRPSDDMPPCLLIAEHQTAGRGRLGRHWESAPAGASLTFSLALPLRGDISGLSLTAGVALAEAFDPPPTPPHTAPPRIRLKWPNDLWLRDDAAPAGGRKLGGILIETTPLADARWVVIGVGLNLGPRHADTGHSAPQPLAHGHAGLHELASDLSAPAALHLAVPALINSLLAFQRHGFAASHAAFNTRDLLRGQPLVTTQDDTPEGLGAGVTDNGALLVLRPDGHTATIHSGEVSVRMQTQTQGQVQAHPPAPFAPTPPPAPPLETRRP